MIEKFIGVGKVEWKNSHPAIVVSVSEGVLMAKSQLKCKNDG